VGVIVVEDSAPDRRGGITDEDGDSDDDEEEFLKGLDESKKYLDHRLAEMIRQAEEAKELRRLGIGVHLCKWFTLGLLLDYMKYDCKVILGTVAVASISMA